MTDIDKVQNLPSVISENENSYEALTSPGNSLLDKSSEPDERTISASYCDINEDDQEPILQNILPQEAIDKEVDTFESYKSTFHKIIS